MRGWLWLGDRSQTLRGTTLGSSETNSRPAKTLLSIDEPNTGDLSSTKDPRLSIRKSSSSLELSTKIPAVMLGCPQVMILASCLALVNLIGDSVLEGIIGFRMFTQGRITDG